MAASIFTTKLRACLDDHDFTIPCTSDGERLVVSRSMRKLIGDRNWTTIQKTCADLQNAGNKAQSVPRRWIMKVTANPPLPTKPKHRRTLRIFHMILRDAWSEGINFNTDKVFKRFTPTLQFDRMLLESSTHWAPEIEMFTPKATRQEKYDMKADKVSDSDCSGSDWSTDEEKSSSPQMKRAKNAPNTRQNSPTEFSALPPHVVSELGPVGGFSSTVQTFLWQNSKGVNGFIEALLKLKSHNSDEERKQDEKKMKKRAFENDEKRKKKAFRNEEKRKQELHDLQKRTIRAEQLDETDIEGEPALVSKMKRLLEIILPEAALQEFHRFALQ